VLNFIREFTDAAVGVNVPHLREEFLKNRDPFITWCLHQCFEEKHNLIT
jgi:hypothetical protein